MKQGRTLQELAAEITRQREAKQDFIAPTRKTVMLDDGKLNLLGQPQAFGVNEVGHGQIAEYTGVPKAYYDRMRGERPDLLARNVNAWLGEKDEHRLVRVLDGRVRGFLSDRYRSLDYFDLAEAVFPVIAQQNLKVVSCEITERRLYIKAFDQGIEREIAKAGTDPAHTFLRDVVFPAIVISNSEVGFGALSVAAGVYTGGCTNFAAFSDSRMRKYHIGAKQAGGEEIAALLSDETKRLTDQAVWAQTRDVVKSAFQIATFQARVNRMQETAQQRLEGDVVKLVPAATQKLGLTQQEGSSVLQHLIEGGDLSRYGLFNAVTRAAQDVESYDRATELEQIGGRIIELPQQDWQRLAKAA